MSLIHHRQGSADAVPSPFDWPLSPSAWWARLDDVFRDGEGRQILRLDEFDEDGTRVVRAELPGIDPDKDVEVTVTDGLLTIRAQRTEEEESSQKRFHRKEIRYGGFFRTVALPEGVAEGDISAVYKDGILEVRVPVATEPKVEAKRIAVEKA